ncbi:MAG: MobF family relaxase [Acidimicrobiia bacterium]
MSLWKLRVGVEAYYLSQVASGLDDYYTGGGEAPGTWRGNSAHALGLDGDVVDNDLRAILAGLAPGTGLTPNGAQLQAHPRRVPGFDFTFAVPKSVSVAYALADPLVQHQIVTAATCAVDETLSWLEREACFVRRGTNNRLANVASADWGTRRVPARGFIAARFPHRTSRAGDPHLHFHVLVANLSQGPDGRWTALDGTALYQTRRAASAVFQHHLRRELTRELPLEWGPVRHDIAELAAIPARVTRAFSTRRMAIEEWLDTNGLHGAAAADRAMLATRPPKPNTDLTALDAEWKQRASALGFGPDHLDALLRQEPTDPVTSFDVDAVLRDVVERSATFTRTDLARSIAARLPHAKSLTLDAAVDTLLAYQGVVPIREPNREPCWSTREHLETERRFLDHVRTGIGNHPGTIPLVFEPDTLGHDQRAALHRLLGSSNTVDVLVGRAGTGKTFLLDTLASNYRIAGRPVIGLAPSARAARELDGPNIAATTIARFLHHAPPLDPGTLVIVDEAGMADTATLTALLDHASRFGSRVLLVGDDHQLPEIGPGGALTAAISVLDAQVAELTMNRRQHEAWEVDALNQLRHGDPLTALAAYQAHDRIVTASTPSELHARVIADWLTHYQRGNDVMLIAGTRSDVTTLNRLARAAIAPTLTGPALDVGDRRFQADDRIITLHNDRHRGVDNGTLATITAVNSNGLVATTGERTISLDRAYVNAHVDHAYALTIHKTQGATCDVALVVGPAGLSREAGYVALSRARRRTTIYATSHELTAVNEHRHGIPLPSEQPATPETRLLERLQQSRRKQFALTIDPDALRIAELAERHTPAQLERVAALARTAEHATSDHTIRQLERSLATRAALSPGRLVRADDRDNIGTTIAIDDATHTATITFVGRTGRATTRQLPWHELTVIDHAEPIDPPPAVLEEMSTHLDAARLERDRKLARYGIQPGDTIRYQTARELALDRAAHRLAAVPPEWLTEALGPRPNDPTGSHIWTSTVRTLVEHEPGTREHQRILTDTCEWLAQRNLTPVPLPPRPAAEIATRRAELEQLLATAPPDQRRLIHELTSCERSATANGQLLEALAAQGQRREWIIGHWPYIVELQQLNAVTTTERESIDRG